MYREKVARRFALVLALLLLTQCSDEADGGTAGPDGGGIAGGSGSGGGAGTGGASTGGGGSTSGGSAGAEHRGRDAVAAFYNGLFVSMPDVIFDLQAAYIGENGVVEESVLVGTHTGDLFGLAPTGRPVHLPLTIVFPMVNGEILGERMYFDMDSLQRQLGLRA